MTSMTTIAATGATATPALTAPAQTARPTPLPLRSDTFLGVCEAIGRDLGFHPNWLRVALSLGMFFSPLGAILTYLGLGVIVALTRWIAPDQLVAVPAQAQLANDSADLRKAA